MQIPAISVIIPMYNAENYINDCLKSFLSQTFTDFEIIVVDDCSTDNSVAIVENYAEKFGGRLKIAKTKQNSGGGGYVGRNLGLKLSRGEYIFFADADDFVVETALEILHTAAKNSAADVIYTPKYYMCGSDGKIRLFTDEETANLHLEDKITLNVGENDKNCRRLIESLFHMPWTKFVRKKLLIDNKITFPKIISGGDFIWSIQVAYFAEKFLRLPISLYFYRDTHDSVTHKQNSAEKQLSDCAKAFSAGFDALNDLENKISLLKSDSFLIFVAQKYFLNNFLQRTAQIRSKLSAKNIYEILHREFADDSLRRMIPFFFTVIDAQQSKFYSDSARIAELEAEINRLKR